MNHGCGKILYAKDDNSNILSILFLVWDEQSVYHLLGGSMPEYQHLQTYNMLTWEGIKTASEMGLKYDFEGSVIKRISKSMRQFGGKPMPYFRIRKVFNLDIIRAEAEEQIQATCKKYGEVTSGICSLVKRRLHIVSHMALTFHFLLTAATAATAICGISAMKD